VKTRDLCERAAALVGAAVRDDLDWPVYVLHRDELREPYCSVPAAGWFDPRGWERHRETVIELTGDDEPGPVLVVSGSDWLAVAGLAIHELAHLIDDGWSLDPAGDCPPVERVVEHLTISAADMRGRLSRLFHGLRWHRCLAHLMGRVPFSRELGALDDVIVAAESYGWPKWYTVRRTFSAEVWERRNEPIRVILADDPPAEAVALFE
jgi:hypothetical protein